MNDIPSTPLQFDTTDGPANAACGVCQQAIHNAYYTVGGTVTCANCRAQVVTSLGQSQGVRGLVRATALGSIPGAAGAALWWAVRRFASLEIGLIAIAIGHFVGVGVRNGSGGRGGWRYQTLAVFLTYFWITANYVPDIIGLARSPQAQTTDVYRSASPTSGLGDGRAISDAEPIGPPTVTQFALALAFLFGIAMAAPFLQGFENIIGILIIGFGLYHAWALNVRTQVDVAGPFHVTPERTPPPVLSV